jgi:predicted AlkP superfamily pyrophosphatase or phosphodiesterase
MAPMLSPIEKSDAHQLPVCKLVCLGVFVHVLFVLSIFDIYFQTPVLQNLSPVWPQSAPPAKRLVIFVADGLRADKLFEWQETPSGPSPRAPFLHDVCLNRGRWGVSHARPPTESRPGHVAILAGFYEDPSAITKGWQANPVEFDHILNRSSAAWGMGSPDIVPLFTKGINHAHGASYSADLQDFSSGSLADLDVWSFDHLDALLQRAKRPPKNGQESAADLLDTDAKPSRNLSRKLSSVRADAFETDDERTPKSKDLLDTDTKSSRNLSRKLSTVRAKAFETEGEGNSIPNSSPHGRSRIADAEVDAWAGVASGAELDAQLRQDRVVIFLHLLGCDSNGHAFRPASEEYLANVKVVDEGIRRSEALLEAFFNDGRTAYVFTADHGMSNKGTG